MPVSGTSRHQRVVIIRSCTATSFHFCSFEAKRHHVFTTNKSQANCNPLSKLVTKQKMMKFVTDAAATVARHYKQGTLNWPMIIYISLAHVAAAIGLFTIPKCHPMTLLWAFILWPISGVGITGGVHRLWAHRSYKASFALRVYLMLSNSIANQGSIWHWSRDHRVHHKHSEVRSYLSSILSRATPHRTVFVSD